MTDALRVVGALFGVSVEVVTKAAGPVVLDDSPSAAPAPVRRRPGRPAKQAAEAVIAAEPALEAAAPAPRKRARAAKKSAPSTVKADPKVMRDWAFQNGYEVSRRGSLPRGIIDAYTAAH